MLHFLQFFYELAFEVNIFVFELALLVRVGGDVVVEFVHFLLQPLEVDADLGNLLLEVLVVRVQSLLLLLHYHLLVLEVHHALVDLLQLVVLVHQHRLLLYPLSVQLVALVLQVLTLTHQVYQLRLLGVLPLVVRLTHQLVVQLVQTPHLVLLLLVDVVALLDLHLVSDHQVLLIVLFSEGLIFFLPQQLDLTLGVQLVDFDPGNLIHNIF